MSTVDVAILGSGIAGSTLAAILAKQGVSMVLSFALGELTIGETSFLIRIMIRSKWFEVTQCNVSEGPFGPESHLMRADFDGGWILWFISFNNHEQSQSDLVSVGLNLDCTYYPYTTEKTADQEWDQFLQRFPAIARQFADAEAVFPWVRTQRTQY